MHKNLLSYKKFTIEAINALEMKSLEKFKSAITSRQETVCEINGVTDSDRVKYKDLLSEIIDLDQKLNVMANDYFDEIKMELKKLNRQKNVSKYGNISEMKNIEKIIDKKY